MSDTHVVNHHHHFSGWDKYDGEWCDSVMWHDDDHPRSETHTQTYKGITEHTTGPPCSWCCWSCG